jgi:hypothetical protein
MTETLTMTIWTKTDIGTSDYAHRLVDVLSQSGWTPSRIGAYEPLRQIFDARDFERLWLQPDREPSASRDVHICTEHSPAARVGVTWRRAPNAGFNTAYLSIPNADLGPELSTLVKVGEALYSVFASSYARAYTKSEFQAQHFSRSKRALQGVRFGPAIPGVYWLNVFGPEIVAFLGPARFESCPAYAKHRLSDGSWVIQAVKSPTEWVLPEVQDLKQAIRKHLGDDAFFDVDRPHRPIRLPVGGYESSSH